MRADFAFARGTGTLRLRAAVGFRAVRGGVAPG
jgi:hypothetical protein